MLRGAAAAAALLLMSVVLAACTSSAAPTAAPIEATTPEPPAFDLAAVKANFIDECKDPAVVDDLFCEQVKIGDMTAAGDILNVPTTLSPAARDRAEAICDAFALAHFDGDGKPLGYAIIGILDMNGGNAAACSVE